MCQFPNRKRDQGSRARLKGIYFFGGVAASVALGWGFRLVRISPVQSDTIDALRHPMVFDLHLQG